ncbi:hypothetical protein OROHE_019144 [Orobanche hederae]
MGGSKNLLFSTLLFFITISSNFSSAQQSFRCSSAGATCNALIDYVSPKSTTLAAVATLFTVVNHRSILGANNLPLSTPTNYPIPAQQTIRIPFPCVCTNNGIGISDRRPDYRVAPEDGLYHIAAEVFSGLVTYQEIAAVNNISDVNLIKVGQNLWIPLPCSCDDVDGHRVVHYGHLVAQGSTVEGIAARYNTSQETLLRLNNLNSSRDLMAGAVLDVPLTMLQCEPSPTNSSCPRIRCEGTSKSLFLGDSSTSSSGCNHTTCVYAGYNNQRILTTTLPALESTCPDIGDEQLLLELACEVGGGMSFA